MTSAPPKSARLQLDPGLYEQLRNQVLHATPECIAAKDWDETV
jgi:hypothetical protein